MSREDLAPSKELDPAALRVLYGKIPLADLGDDETPQDERYRTSGFLQFVLPPALAQIDPADARMFACSSESSQGVGNG